MSGRMDLSLAGLLGAMIGGLVGAIYSSLIVGYLDGCCASACRRRMPSARTSRRAPA